ncbi:MAG: 3-oxoacyl-ACP reductase FabG [Oscillospiraceae bacterium]|nr:3-oxoacyl-ACP reductase FabG [Oscillospiraceae bacterium]
MEVSNNKVALVTGASRGIGRACAVKLAECGYDVVVNYVSNDAKASEVCAEIEGLGRKAFAAKADTSDLKAVQNMFREVWKEFGRIDVLVNNAGVVDDAYLLMINEESLSRSLDINIKGYFHCAQQAALKMMKTGGKIINVSSVSSILAVEGQGVYSATKGAVNSMTATLAKELAPRNITVNAIAPGFIETEMMDSIPEDKKAEYINAVPMGRFGSAEQIAETVVMLCSSAFDYMTGQVIVLDGGLSL